MHNFRPLPGFLVDRYHTWRESLGPAERARLAKLAATGQAPQAMVIACCDSRVMATDVFRAEAGELFVHRNIANLVPPCQPDGQQHGTSATIEFAVTVLKVRHLIVMGHSGCGGVEGCLDLHGPGANVPAPSSFVSHWLEILAPRVAAVTSRGLDRAATLRALEHEAVLLSLGNLMTFPFVRAAVEGGRLELHGLWKDIGDGDVTFYDAGSRSFVPL